MGDEEEIEVFLLQCPGCYSTVQSEYWMQIWAIAWWHYFSCGFWKEICS